MRFSIIAVLFAASLVSAFTVLKRQGSAPACATTCLTSSDPTPCKATDTPCLCLNANFLSAVATCTESSCSAQDLEAAAAAGEAYCTAAGVDPQNPFPPCAETCIQNTASSSCTADAASDDACLCKDTTYVKAVNQCVQTSCTGQDLTTAQTAGSALCRAAGVDISSTVGAA